MKKNEKEIKKTPEQTKLEQEQKELQEKTERVAKQIEVLLKNEEMALQPLLSSSEYGIIPRVRLVPVPKEEIEAKALKKDDK